MTVKKAHSEAVSSQKGVALAVLLWFIAALSLMVAGIVLSARVDVKLAQQQTLGARTTAIGDGVVNLVMRHLESLQQRGEYSAGNALVLNFSAFEQSVSAMVVPAIGLVPINEASPELWYQLLVFGANLDAAHAELLVDNIQAWLQPPIEGESAVSEPLRRNRFMVVEDLLLVEGMNREILERIRLLISPRKGGAGIVLRGASPEMLRVLMGGDVEAVSQFLTDREFNPAVGEQGHVLIDPLFIAANDTASKSIRIDVRIADPDGQIMQFSRWVSAGAKGRDGLPWQRLRAEPIVVVNSVDFLAKSEDAQWH